MVEYVKQLKKKLKMIIFLLTLSLKKKWLILFLNYQQINLVCLITPWFYSKTVSASLLLKAYNLNGCLKNKMFLDNLENTQITPCLMKKNKGNKENDR